MQVEYNFAARSWSRMRVAAGSGCRDRVVKEARQLYIVEPKFW